MQKLSAKGKKERKQEGNKKKRKGKNKKQVK